MMTDEVIGKTPAQVGEMVEAFSEMITKNEDKNYEDLLGDAVVLEGVAQFPARIKCATFSLESDLPSIREGGQSP